MSNETAIDWNDIRRRLDDMHSEVTDELTISPEELKHLLKERAAVLAREPAATMDTAGQMDVVAFELAGECYAFDLECVREICTLKELTPVPCTPPFVLGIINLRGEIHTVIDLKTYFDLPNRGITELNKVLIIESNGMRLGLLADTISGVQTIALDTLHSALPTLTGIRAEYLKGVTSERLIVLDVPRILSDDSLMVCDNAEA